MGGLWCFLSRLIDVLLMSFVTEMIEQFVSNIGMFGQKSKFFIRPLQFKDHAPSLDAFKHIRGGVVMFGWPRKVY